jgi:hypothetical protein
MLEWSAPSGVNVCCFLSSLPYSPSLSHHVSVWSYLYHLSTPNLQCVAGASLPIHLIGEVLWDPKRRRVWASSILSECTNIRKGLLYSV